MLIAEVSGCSLQPAPDQAFAERFQAMRPTMPWAPPPHSQPPDPAAQWASGQDSLEAHVRTLTSPALGVFKELL